jgi:hypothetical protein
MSVVLILRTGRAIALAAVWSVLAGAAVAASVSLPVEFRAIVSDAQLIVRGHVTDVRAVHSGENGVESVATVAVDATLKGQAGGFVSVRVPGGVMGRYHYVMVGAPTLRVDESAVFFLQRAADGAWRPVGLGAGIVAIRRDPANGAAVVQPPVMQAARTGPGPVVRGDVRRAPLPVGDFESLVRMMLVSRTAQPRAAR